MTLLATLGYAVQAVVRLELSAISPTGGPARGRSEAVCRRWMMVASQAARRRRHPRPRLRRTAPVDRASCCASPARRPASLSLNLYAVAQMFAGPRASGTWVGVQNALGNLSGIFGPIITGIIVDRAGYATAFPHRRGRRVRRAVVGGRRSAHRANRPGLRLAPIRFGLPTRAGGQPLTGWLSPFQKAIGPPAMVGMSTRCWPSITAPAIPNRNTRISHPGCTASSQSSRLDRNAQGYL